MGRCYNSIVIKAPIDKVWQTLRDFHDLSWAAGVVEKTEVVGDARGDQLGAGRILNDAFHERLLELSDLTHTIQYAITDGPGPVAADAVRNYVGSVHLSSVTDDDSTFVEWTSTYDSANDSAVGELCNPIYRALLGSLKSRME